MGLSTALIWEVRQAGSASNGGGFRNHPFQIAPSVPAVSGLGSGGTVAANTYYVVITYTTLAIETPISGETAVTTTGTTSSITVTHPADPGNTATWNCYVGTTSGGPYFPQGTGLVIGTNRVITTTPPTTGTQPAGTDRTLATTPFVAIDNAAITATTAGANSNVLTLSGYTPTGADIGNVFKAVSGTNITAGWYEITAITATTWTVSGAANLTTAGGAGAAIIGNMGGAVAHPSSLASVAQGGNTIFVKYSATPYTFGAALTFSQTGLYIQGYDTTRTIRNADASRPIFRPSANNILLFNCNNNICFYNLDFDNPTPQTGVSGISVNNGVVANCRFNTYQALAVQVSNGGLVADCELINCGSGNIALYMAGIGSCERVLARGCSSTGQGVFLCTPGASFEDCVSYGAVNSIGFNGSGYFRGCVAYGGTTSFVQGFSAAATSHYDRCIAYGNSGWGFSTASGQARYARLTRCYTGANSLGGINPAALGIDQQSSCVALSGDPFTNAAAFDFSLNNIAGAGAACRGLTVALPGGATTSYPDAGAAQHSDASTPQAPTYYAY